MSVIKSHEEFYRHFCTLDRKTKYNLLLAILSENEEELSNMFGFVNNQRPSEVGFTCLRKIPSQDIQDIQDLLESILIDTINNKLDHKFNIANRIRVLVLYKKTGLSLGFLTSKVIYNPKVSIKLKIHFAKLIPIIDPTSQIVDWNINKYPYLIPAFINFRIKDPISVLIKISEIKKCPEKEILDSIISQPLSKLLVQLFNNRISAQKYFSKVLPALKKHWLYGHIENKLQSDEFITYSKTIFEQKEETESFTEAMINLTINSLVRHHEENILTKNYDDQAFKLAQCIKHFDENYPDIFHKYLSDNGIEIKFDSSNERYGLSWLKKNILILTSPIINPIKYLNSIEKSGLKNMKMRLAKSL